MNELILEELYKTLPLKERQGTGGMRFKYIPNENVIDKMNKVFKGNWSTNVTYKEIIEDQLIMEVLVTVSDPDTEVQFSHTGFSSQPIARYKEGVNAGKIVDLGNIYKSALAKAIVNACTRWGVGLFKETNVYGTDDVVSTPSVPAAPVGVPPVSVNVSSPPPIAAPIAAPPVAPPNVPVIPNQRVVTSSTVLTQAVPPAPIDVPQQPIVQAPVVELPKVPVPNQETVVPILQEVVAPIPVVQPIQSVLPVPPAVNTVVSPPPLVNSVPSTPSVPFAAQPTEVMGISDVQCVALNGILDMQGIEYGVLAKEAFDERGISKPIPRKEELNYEDAVVIIKYGNDKFRKR